MTPCIHRGEVWREAVNRLCGMRGQMELIYRCQIHTICTHRKYKHGQPEQVCLACSDYTEANDGENKDTAKAAS